MWRIVIALPLFIAITSTFAQDKKNPAPKAEPRILLAIPLGAAPGKTTKLTLRGISLDDAKEVRLVAGKGSVKLLSKGKAGVPGKNPDKVGDTQIEIELKLDADFVEESVSVVAVTPAGETKPHGVLVETKLPVVAEKEPNDGFRTSQQIVVPAVVEGTIGRPKDVDVIRIDGKKGQKLHAEIFASRHGSSLDSVLTLYDAKNQQLAISDDFAKDHRDARIDFVLPTDGVYYLSLMDAHDTGSNLHVYRLAIK